MLVKYRNNLYCFEISCYCNEQSLILVDDKDKSKIYYTCKNYDTPCGYFILASNLQKCHECDVYYYKQCLNPTCSFSTVWARNANDNYI